MTIPTISAMGAELDDLAARVSELEARDQDRHGRLQKIELHLTAQAAGADSSLFQNKADLPTAEEILGSVAALREELRQMLASEQQLLSGLRRAPTGSETTYAYSAALWHLNEHFGHLLSDKAADMGDPRD